MARVPVARIGDTGSHGGAIGSGSSIIQANGKQIALVGDIYNCPIHGPNPIVTGAENVYGKNRKIAHIGSKTACGAVITSGFPNVFIGIHESYEITDKENITNKYDEQIVAIDNITGRPICYYPFFIETEEGTIYKGRTDDSGKTLRIKTNSSQILTVYWSEDTVLKWNE